MSYTRTITTMNFGQALEAIKEGKKVTRTGWNGRGMYLWLLPKADIQKSWIKDPMLLSLYEELNVEVLTCEAAIRMKTAQGTVLTGWQPTQVDMLSEDWVEYVGDGTVKVVIQEN